MSTTYPTPLSIHQAIKMSAQSASGTSFYPAFKHKPLVRSSLVNAGSKTQGLGLTNSLAPLLPSGEGMLPNKVRGTLIKG